jgi:hypothetical protein
MDTRDSSRARTQRPGGARGHLRHAAHLMGRRVAVAASLGLGAALLTAGTPILASAKHTETMTVTIRAFIDGRSDLILQDDNAQWHHFDFSVPGKNGGNNFATIFDGDKWFPTWPPLDGNNGCSGCFSNVFHDAGLPDEFSAVTLKVISCRESCTLTSNGSQLTIHYDDNAIGGAAWYVVKLVFTVADD